MARTPLSGTQHSLRAGDYEAIIASVGASLRTLTFDGRDLVVPFDADEVRPSYRGATLAPWPNRVVDGIYTFGGVERQVALTDRPAITHCTASPDGSTSRRPTRARPRDARGDDRAADGLPVARHDQDDLLARCRRS